MNEENQTKAQNPCSDNRSGSSDCSAVIAGKQAIESTAWFWMQLPNMIQMEEDANSWSESAASEYGTPHDIQSFTRCLKWAFLSGAFFAKCK